MKKLRTGEYCETSTPAAVVRVGEERVEVVDQDDLQSMDECAKDWVKAWYKEVRTKRR